MQLRPILPTDWPAVARIYAAGIASGHATFETTVPTWEHWEAAHLASMRLVAGDDGRVLGWSALSPVSTRCVYGGVAEVSAYVDPDAGNRGVGGRLLDALISGSEEDGLWTLRAMIFPENVASLTLHEHRGFRVVGRRARLGQLAGRWRDVLLLERRSDRVGLAD
ncbi:MAG: GNAT family N-acetyltransferase [Gemmatimonadaceae bacterium]